MRRAGTAGFTLVELLVSLAILGLVASMVLSGVGAAAVMARRDALAASRTDEIAAAHRLLRARLERIMPLTRLDSNAAIVAARGTDTRFTFYAAPLARAEPDAPARFRLALTAAGDLTLFTASGLDDRIDPDEETLLNWTPTVLARDIGALSIAYYGADPNFAGRRWLSFWSDRPQPPDLIRVRVTPRDRAVSWPDLVVRPRATVNTACAIDKLSGRCAEL